MKAMIALAFILLLMSFSATAQNMLRIGEITSEKVTAIGYGATRQEAVLRALDSAVAQVNGVKVSGTQVSVPVVNRSLTVNQSTVSSTVSIDSEVVEFVARNFEGLVLNYKVISLNQAEVSLDNNTKGWLLESSRLILEQGFKAEVEASIASYNDIDNSINLAYSMSKSALISDAPQSDALFETLRTELLNGFTAINKFNIIDPEKDAVLEQVYQRINSDRVDAREQAVLGRQVAADIVFNVDRLQITTNREVIRFRGTDRIIENFFPALNLSYSLLDVGKGVVLFSNTVSASSEQTSSTELGHVFNDLISTLSKDLIKDLVNREFPAQVLAVDGRTASINRGEPFMVRNDVYDAVYLLAELTDPSTGRSLGNEERYCCSISISSVGPYISQGTIQGGPLEPHPIVLREMRRNIDAIQTDRADVAPSEPRLDINSEFQLLDNL